MTDIQPISPSTLVSHLWLVTGSTGEYSDRSEWVVAAFATEAKAQRYAELAQNEADRIDSLRPNRYNSAGMDNRFDRRMSMDYTGTRYRHEMVKLHRVVSV
jgi:hypothetical protein